MANWPVLGQTMASPMCRYGNRLCVFRATGPTGQSFRHVGQRAHRSHWLGEDSVPVERRSLLCATERPSSGVQCSWARSEVGGAMLLLTRRIGYTHRLCGSAGASPWDDETVLVFCHDRIVGATGGSFVPPVSSESRVKKQRALANEDARQWHPKPSLDTTGA